MRLKYALILICYIAILFPLESWAVSSNVPPDSNLYLKLEKLRSFGLITTHVNGFKPLSRMEFARQIKEAIQKREKTASEGFFLADKILEELKKEFKDEITNDKSKVKNRFLNETQTEVVFLNQNASPHLETNSFNRSMASNRMGEKLSDGINNVWRINGWIDFPEYFSIYVEPKLITRQKEDNFYLDIPRGYIKLGSIMSNFF